MPISFNIGVCPDCGVEHTEDILHFLFYTGWIEMEGSTDEVPVVGLNPLIVDALFRTCAEPETVDIIERLLFDDTVKTYMENESEEEGDETPQHKPILTVV